MKSNERLSRKKKARLKEFEYSQNGAYFITICVKDKQKLLGEIVGAGFSRPRIVLSNF